MRPTADVPVNLVSSLAMRLSEEELRGSAQVVRWVVIESPSGSLPAVHAGGSSSPLAAREERVVGTDRSQMWELDEEEDDQDDEVVAEVLED